MIFCILPIGYSYFCLYYHAVFDPVSPRVENRNSKSTTSSDFHTTTTRWHFFSLDSTSPAPVDSDRASHPLAPNPPGAALLGSWPKLINVLAGSGYRFGRAWTSGASAEAGCRPHLPCALTIGPWAAGSMLSCPVTGLSVPFLYLYPSLYQCRRDIS